MKVIKGLKQDIKDIMTSTEDYLNIASLRQQQESGIIASTCIFFCLLMLIVTIVIK